MTRIFIAIILLLTLGLPAKPTCRTVYSNGRPWCVCWVTGKGWQPAPKLACSVWEVKPGNNN